MKTNAIYPSKTALDSRFEEELASLPGWKPDHEIPHAARDHKARPARETSYERRVEELMILGR